MYKYQGKKTKLVKKRMHYEKLRRKRWKRRKRNKKNDIIEEKKISYHFFKFLLKRKFIYNRLESKKFKKSKTVLKIPEICSVSKNPEDIIALLRKIVNIYDNNKIKTVILDYSNCKYLCISASALITTFITSLIKYREQNNAKIFVTGKNSKNKKVNLILDVTGVKKSIGQSMLSDNYIENMKEIEQTALITSDPIIKYNPKPKKSSSEVTTEINKFIKKSYRSINKKINQEGLNKLSKFISEIVDNCNIHPYNSKLGFSQWFLKAFFFKNDVNRGEISIIIYNFGQTIYESLKSQQDTYDSLTIKMFNYLNRLTSKISRYGFNEEELWTFYSLQERISQKLKTSDSDRGTGTIEFIKNLQDISSDNDIDVAMLSGNSMIIFDKKYSISVENNRHIISLNTEDSLSYPPDKNNLISLKSNFPGTVFVFNFKINSGYLN